MFSLSPFADLLKLIPRRVFDKAVQASGSDRYAKTLQSWDMLLLMIFGNLQQAKSLRQLTFRFNQHDAQHYHLNTRQVQRSTLSDALSKRSVEPFEVLCQHLISQVSRQDRKALKSLTYLVDSTPIQLLANRFSSWTGESRVRSNRGLKIHMVMNLDNGQPHYVNLTPPNVNDVTDARNLPIKSGATYVMDKGYTHYNWWYEIDQKGGYFVTRIKRNAAIKSIQHHPLPADSEVILDDTIHLTNKAPRAGHINHYAHRPLRRIILKVPHRKEPLALVTNDFKRSAEDIAELYKNRWQIELLFKWLKQNLKLKQFFGSSENAVKIQIYGALIAYILVNLKHGKEGHQHGFTEYVWRLREILMTRPKTEQNYYRKRLERARFIAKVQPELSL